MTIANIQELKDFILNNELSKNDINEILRATLKVWICKEYNKTELVNIIEDFYYKYPNVQDRPLFLDVPNDEISIKDFGFTVFD
ncbi:MULTISPECIES: hypothetical protein [unclassified Flavobacterium]|uniref:hypothetical protein n=1 Tax=unclassified Flavobacterium TaxID=196869 RepID=UPI000F823076|nr:MULTISPECIES: hypothetical protein [unclassified Flavobacterium]RTY64804.1 hypothetical protein EKL95_13965 [Flavobacterium sp. LB2P53]RTZ03002.1 hypothetical protein EKM03_13855 [Flavobacterium sp. GSP6]